MQNKVVLFDIDWTLVKGGTGPVFIDSFRKALKNVLGIILEKDFDITPHEGKVSIQFVRDLAVERGIALDVANNKASELMQLSEDYVMKKSGGLFINTLPGTKEILEELKNKGFLLGLLTGNTKKVSELKLKKANLYKYFSFGAYGDESFKRTELVEMARKRAEEVSGRHITKDDIFLIGDSPRDIQCGKEAGVKTIAVSTGPNSFEMLLECKPDLLLHSLEEKDKLISFIEKTGKINP